MTTANPNALQKMRTFTRLSQAEKEVIDARVFVGIHYRTSDQRGRAQGHRVANWVFKNYFRPIGDPRFGHRASAEASNPGAGNEQRNANW